MRFTRRNFIKTVGAAGLALAAAPHLQQEGCKSTARRWCGGIIRW